MLLSVSSTLRKSRMPLHNNPHVPLQALPSVQLPINGTGSLAPSHVDTDAIGISWDRSTGTLQEFFSGRNLLPKALTPAFLAPHFQTTSKGDRACAQARDDYNDLIAISGKFGDKYSDLIRKLKNDRDYYANADTARAVRRGDGDAVRRLSHFYGTTKPFVEVVVRLLKATKTPAEREPALNALQMTLGPCEGAVHSAFTQAFKELGGMGGTCMQNYVQVGRHLAFEASYLSPKSLTTIGQQFTREFDALRAVDGDGVAKYPNRLAEGKAKHLAHIATELLQHISRELQGPSPVERMKAAAVVLEHFPAKMPQADLTALRTTIAGRPGNEALMQQVGFHQEKLDREHPTPPPRAQTGAVQRRLAAPERLAQPDMARNVTTNVAVSNEAEPDPVIPRPRSVLLRMFENRAPRMEPPQLRQALPTARRPPVLLPPLGRQGPPVWRPNDGPRPLQAERVEGTRAAPQGRGAPPLVPPRPGHPAQPPQNVALPVLPRLDRPPRRP